jgi:hypothetical protein
MTGRAGRLRGWAVAAAAADDIDVSWGWRTARAAKTRGSNEEAPSVSRRGLEIRVVTCGSVRAHLKEPADGLLDRFRALERHAGHGSRS